MSAALPPRLRNDCFAMPQGVEWMPVEEALCLLKERLTPVVSNMVAPPHVGQVLSDDVFARRSNPPRPNAAVDGYGFAHAATGAGIMRLPLAKGRAAAGAPYEGVLAHGQALRILTGAILPGGVDTVILEEDCTVDGGTVVFDGPVKPGINTRQAGEDVSKGDLALPKGHRVRAPDLALLAALGVGQVPVHAPLRVGVLSTGDEIVSDPGTNALAHQIYDANRPMLLPLLRGWHCEAHDLGHVGDDAQSLRTAFDAAAEHVDVIITSGGASLGDEDHVSRLLRAHGDLTSWRIAIKPGRPLALAMWRGVPVFGLPGNPVAALVCALIFARPALSLMAGAGWQQPQGFLIPAGFTKRKKAGRREFLRARLHEGRAEIFKSEGSGRISGLSWATGLVELPDHALEINPTDPVLYYPYTAFGME